MKSNRLPKHFLLAFLRKLTRLAYSTWENHAVSQSEQIGWSFLAQISSKWKSSLACFESQTAPHSGRLALSLTETMALLATCWNSDFDALTFNISTEPSWNPVRIIGRLKDDALIILLLLVHPSSNQNFIFKKWANQKLDQSYDFWEVSFWLLWVLILGIQ